MTALFAFVVAAAQPLDEARGREMGIEVRPGPREVRVVLSKGKDADVPAVRVRRRAATMVGTLTGRRLSEVWKQETLTLASGRVQTWRSELTFQRPGRYAFSLGRSEGELGISRAGFDGWERQLAELRDAADRLERVARGVDAVKAPTLRQMDQLQREVQAERAKLERLRTEFEASAEAFRDALDRLQHQWVLLRAPKMSAADVEAYKAQEPEVEVAQRSALDQVRGLKELVLREGTLIVVDELALLLEEEDPRKRVIFWRSREAALDAARKACEQLGELPELAALVGKAREKAEPDAAVRERLAALRQTLLK